MYRFKASPKDIEELATAGRNAQTCPYYGSRRAIPQAEVSQLYHWCAMRDLMLNLQLVTLPYNLLLQKSAREALGIDLTNQIVIIDEAHSRHLPCILLYRLKVYLRFDSNFIVTLKRPPDVQSLIDLTGAGFSVLSEVS